MSEGTPPADGSEEVPADPAKSAEPPSDSAGDANPAETSAQPPTPVPAPPAAGSPPPASSDEKSPDRWSRRNLILAGLGVLASGVAGGVTWYYTARSDERDARAVAMDSERHTWELPPPTGDSVRILEARAGEYVPLWTQAFVSGEAFTPRDFQRGTDLDAIYRMIFDRGGCWYGRMSVDIVIESLRRTVLISGAKVDVRSLGTPPDTTIFVPAPFGGPGEETEILHTGINLDAPRPVVRTLSPDMHTASTLEEQASVKNDPIKLTGPFPAKQITLGPHDVSHIRVLAETRSGCYEWEISIEIIADGQPQSVPIKVTNYPLRIAAAVPTYRVPLMETEPGSGSGIGLVELLTMEELRRWL